ncbi:MAG: hypothetical protein ACTS6H_00345 [Candidatus Hodgkinia cicadicola]
MSVIVLEKSSVIGGHSLSGAILERNETNESLMKGLKLTTLIKADRMWHLT